MLALSTSHALLSGKLRAYIVQHRLEHMADDECGICLDTLVCEQEAPRHSKHLNIFCPKDDWMLGFGEIGLQK